MTQPSADTSGSPGDTHDRAAAASDADAIGRQFASFTLVGVVGFTVDAALFLLLSGGYLWSIAAARTVSASCSIATTWALNRHLTFAARSSPHAAAELLRYALVLVIGLLVNIGIFSACLALVPSLRRVPIVALVVGAAAALAFNFSSTRALAFRGRSESN